MSEDIVTWLRERVWTDDPPKLDEAADEIERLRAELAAQADIHTDIQMRLSDERDELRAQLADAREALEPFAKEADEWSGYDDAELLVEPFPEVPSSLMVCDLRRARAVYERTKGGGDE